MPNEAETMRFRSPGAKCDGVDESLAVTSSASESSAVPALRDLQGWKSPLVHDSEHRRDKLCKTNRALETETDERNQEAPTLINCLRTELKCFP